MNIISNKKALLKSLKVTIGFIITSLFGLFSNIDQLFGFNIYSELIVPNKPHSYIYILLSYILIFLIVIILEQSRYNHANLPTKSDLAILERLSKDFPLDNFYVFKEYLAQNRAVSISQIDDFSDKSYRLLESDMKILNETIENAKSNFLHSLIDFIDYASNRFEPIVNPDIVKFYGGKSEYELMKDPGYLKEGENYLNIVREVALNWDILQKVVKEEYPNFVWKNR